MLNIIDFLISKEAITTYIVIGIATTSYIVFSLVKKFKKTDHEKLMERNTEELKNLVDDVKELEKTVIIPKEEAFTIKVPFDSIKVEDIAPKGDFKDVETKLVEVTPVKEEKAEDIEILTLDYDGDEREENVKEIKEAPKKEKKEKLNARLDEIIENDVPEIEYAKSIAPEKEEAKKELEDTITKLEAAQDGAEEKNIELTEFEKMQEDTAIISIDELMAKAKESYDANEKYEDSYQDEGNEPITIDELEARRAPKEEIKITEEKEVKNNISEERKFKSSPIISPIFGIEKHEKNVNDLELENTANYEKLDEEIRKTNEFIGTLKELQKKLN